jgi:hypothetical protein
MATLHEYFIKDGAQNLTTHQTWPLTDEVTGATVGEITARLHFDFEALAKYVSFYIPEMSDVECPEAIALNQLETILNWPQESVGVRAGFGQEWIDGRDLVFTGQVYVYSERPLRENLKIQLLEKARGSGHHLTFRSTEYLHERNKWEKPRAFIAHDSRDKKEIAEPIALQLQKWMCPVWFDQYSLRVGDSLRESIEQGLTECQKCVLILTPNFLNNNGWTKREYDSVFTRELVERQKVILPVWHGITVEDVYKYSPILADRVGAEWANGLEEVARKLLLAIDAKGS